MEDEILVSVIMPVYNAKKWLDRSVASLLNQTIRRTEIIIINDGSTDGSDFVLEKWAAADRCIKVIQRDNQGVSASRNEGIKAAKGKYICFADADDYIESDMLRQMTQALRDTGAHVAMCDYYEESPDGNKETVSLPWEAMQVLDRGQVRKELIPFMIKVQDKDRKEYPQLKNNICGTVWRICVEKQFLVDNSIFFDENMRIAEDFNFCVRLFEKAGLVAIVRNPLYHYIRWDSTTMAVYRKDQFEVGIRNQIILKNFLIECGMYESVKERFYGSYIDEVMSVPYNFTRPNGPGFFNKISELRKITGILSEDAMLKEASHNLSFNQKIALWLIRHHMALTLYILTVIRKK